MYGQKRAHSPDGYEDNNFRQAPFQPHYGRGGHHGGPPFQPQQQYFGYQQHQKRHRNDHYQAPVSLEDKIARLGETGSRPVEIGILAKDIDADLISKNQDEERINHITSKICKCIISFPTRIGTYATLIGLISVKHYNIACQIIQTLHASYPVYLEAQKWSEALTIIHLLSSLVNCNVIRPSALLSQFEFLLESTLEDNIPQVRSDYYVYTVLSSLPYVAFELSQQEETKENFEKMLTTIEEYLSKRTKAHLNSIRVWMSSDSTIQMDYLDSLWVQMKNFRANNWVETYLNRPYSEKEYKDIMASSLIPTNSPTFQIPGHSDKYIYPSPRIVFRIYEDDVTEKQNPIPGSDKIERFCIENAIRYTIDEHSTDTKNCARHLSNLMRCDQIPLKHLLIETILGELFMIPTPKHDELLYASLLYDFTKIFHIQKHPDEIKNNYEVVLNEAVRVLFNNLDTMNVTCYTRLVKWLSFYLNNTSFLFPWQAWTDALNKPKYSQTNSFVGDILKRCVRFLYHEKVETLVQDNLKPLLPPKAAVKFQPVFIDNPKAQEMNDMIRKMIGYKEDDKEICQKLNIRINNVELPEDFVLKEEKLSDQLLKVDIFTAVLLDMAQRSVTHLSSAFGKYLNVLKTLVQVPQGQFQLLQTLQSCLEGHTHLQVILIDKLLKAELLNAREICNWIFSESMKPSHCEAYTWEILDNTLSRVRQNIENIRIIKDKHNEEEFQRTQKEEKKTNNDGSGTPNAADDDEANKTDGDDVEMKEADNTEEEKKRAHEEEQAKFNDQIISSQKEFRDLLIHVFVMFAGLLRDHISTCEGESRSFIDSRYRWIVGRMQEVYYNYHQYTHEIVDEIRRITDAIPSIGEVIINLNQ